MANAADTISVMEENLRDIGLDDETIGKCLGMFKEKRYAELDKLLKAYRKKLLDSVHSYEKRIDCLDYFTYTLRKMEVH